MPHCVEAVAVADELVDESVEVVDAEARKDAAAVDMDIDDKLKDDIVAVNELESFET